MRYLRMILLACVFAPPAGAADTPQVVASIKPLHSLAAAVMEGVGEPALLVRGADSGHSYALRPSDRQVLDDAAVVFWIGPQFETFLERPLAALTGAKVVAVSALPGLRILPARAGGFWKDAQASEPGAPSSPDPHLWLDPGNAKIVARAMAKALEAKDPTHATKYRRNADALIKRLGQLDDELRVKLAPAAMKPFVVYHDALHYFDAHYGLAAVGAITVSPDRAPGAARISAIKQQAEGGAIACVFSEPPFEPKLATMIAAGTAARTGALDAEGIGLDPGPMLYFNLMRQLADNLVGCLAIP